MANRPLEGVRVLCGGKSQEDSDRLLSDVGQLGGAAVAECADASPPDVLIATCVACKAYKDARDDFPAVPRVSATWLAACRIAGGKVAYEEHRLKPFSGLEISVSGGYGGEKQKAAELVRQHGGTYTPNMTRSCTHLVILGPKGDNRDVSTKETHARQWKTVTLVWGDWLQDNASTGLYKGNEKAFLVPPPRSFRPPSQPGHYRGASRAPGESQAHASANTVAGPLPTPSMSHAASDGSLPTIGTRVGDNRLEPEASRAVLRQPSTLPAFLGDLPPASSSAPLPSEDDDRDYLFLSEAIVHLACCTPAEHLEMLRILREGACTRRPDLRDDVTHIVVGSDLTRPEIQAIGTHMKVHGHVCKLCSPQWLRRCLATRQELPVTAALELRAAALLDTVTRAAKEAEDRQAEAAAAAALAAAGEATTSQRKAAGTQFLEGLFFLLTPLLEGSDREFAQRKIRDAGGRLFDRLSLKAVPGPDAAFAVCPLSMPPPDSSRLKDDPAFGMVPEEHRVTVRWLDVSQDRGQPLVPIPSAWEFLLCKPLPHKLPLPGMEHVVATASLYGEQEKGWIKMAIKTLGGKYTVKMSVRNTHLIVRSAAGPKFTGAAAFRVKPVTIDWLFQMAGAGRLLPEAHYYPPLPADGENTEGTQFAFEASTQPKPPQAKTAAGGVRIAAQKRSAMAQSSQHNQAAAGAAAGQRVSWKIGDRPQSQQRLSNVESLFSQLKSPAKPRQPGQARGRPPRPGSAGGSESQSMPKETRAGEQANGSPEAAAELFAGEQQEEEEGQEGSDDDMDEHLLRLEGALTAQAARMMMPGLDSQADPVEPLNRTRRMPSDQGARPGGMSGRGGKRAKPAAHSCSGTSASMQSGDVESSQQVGYEDTVGSRPPPPRTRGSSRAAAASLREAEDKKRLLERMAGAIGGVPRGTQDALLGD